MESESFRPCASGDPGPLGPYQIAWTSAEVELLLSLARPRTHWLLRHALLLGHGSGVRGGEDPLFGLGGQLVDGGGSVARGEALEEGHELLFDPGVHAAEHEDDRDGGLFDLTELGGARTPSAHPEP